MSDSLGEVARLGRRRAELSKELDEVTAALIEASRAAIADGASKFYVARDAGVTRRTLDAWLSKPWG